MEMKSHRDRGGDRALNPKEHVVPSDTNVHKTTHISNAAERLPESGRRHLDISKAVGAEPRVIDGGMSRNSGNSVSGESSTDPLTFTASGRFGRTKRNRTRSLNSSDTLLGKRPFWHNLQHQPPQKIVDADPTITEVYHHSSLYGKVALSVKVRTLMRAGWLGFSIHMAEGVGAALSGVLYIYASYQLNHVPQWVAHYQNAISIFFAVDYALTIFSANVRLHYATSWGGIIDCISVLPVILVFDWTPGAVITSLLKLLQFMRILRLYHLMYKLGIRGSTLNQKLFVLIFSTLGMVILDAGILQWVELRSGDQDYIPFFECCWFVWVTVSTVGYGDVTPKTEWGRLVGMLTILMALVVLPYQLTQLVNLAATRPYGGALAKKKVSHSEYVVVSGSISYPKMETFLCEFYRLTHDKSLTSYVDLTSPLRTLILAPFRPSYQLEALIARYNGLVEFFEGTPLREGDMKRVQIRTAAAVYLLANSSTQDPEAEDSAQIVRALSVYRYCGRDVRIIVEVLRPEAQNSAVWGGVAGPNVEVVCLEILRFRLLARSCIIKGLSTLITNLFVSEVKLNFPPGHYMAEYQQSFDCECYPLLLPEAFHNILFDEVTDFVYKNWSVVLFGLDVPAKQNCGLPGRRQVLLYPRGRRIRPGDVGLILTTDLGVAFKISAYGKPRLAKWLERLHFEGHSVAQTKGIDSLLVKTGTRNKQTPTTLSSLDEVAAAGGAETEGQQAPMSSSRQHAAPYKELLTEVKGVLMRAESFLEAPMHAIKGMESLALGKHGVNRAASGVGLREPEEEVLTKTNEREKGERLHAQSVEQAMETLLAWPPSDSTVRPVPAGIHIHKEKIQANLVARTLGVVHLPEDHILICCQGSWPINLFFFIATLRRPGYSAPPIVILYPTVPTSDEWGNAGMFDNVYWVAGSPLSELDLLRAGVLSAMKVVVIADHGVPLHDALGVAALMAADNSGGKAYNSDVNNILITANCEDILDVESHDRMLVEMQHGTSMLYLSPQLELSQVLAREKDWECDAEPLLHFAPAFIQGKVSSPSWLSFMLRSTYHNRATKGIVEQLIMGGPAPDEGDDDSSASCHLGRTLATRNLEQISMPSEFSGHPYIELFHHLLINRQQLALGLYRPKGTLEAPMPYVFTNPPHHTPVHEGDLVYVLV